MTATVRTRFRFPRNELCVEDGPPRRQDARMRQSVRGDWDVATMCINPTREDRAAWALGWALLHAMRGDRAACLRAFRQVDLGSVGLALAGLRGPRDADQLLAGGFEGEEDPLLVRGERGFAHLGQRALGEQRVERDPDR